MPPLPNCIEMVPLAEPVQAEIVVPGSKSITNRALILAALASGRTTLRGALWSEDTQVMVECLERLGFDLAVEQDPEEPCNRTITVQGRGGQIPKAGSVDQPLELFVGNAGTAARFLTALVCLGDGVYRLEGVPRMRERPQAALFEALRQLGYKIESSNDRLPALIHGGGRRPGLCWVNITESSQFASALLLCSKVAGWEVELAGENEEEASDLVTPARPGTALVNSRTAMLSGNGYAALTSKVMGAFPDQGGTFQIEPDASSASYFWAAGHREVLEYKEQTSATGQVHRSCLCGLPTVRVAHWPDTGWQIDQHFAKHFEKIRLFSPFFESESQALSAADRGQRQSDYHAFLKHLQEMDRELRQAGLAENLVQEAQLNGRTISRRTDLGDSIMTAIVMAPLGILPTRFTDLGRLRLQECERVAALRVELSRCGAKVIEVGDTLTVYPSQLHGAEVQSYNDHRMAMCFAILGLKIPGIRINNPGCVKKTFPNFFQKLAAAPPHGLGATILDGQSGRPVPGDDLFAA